MPNNTRLILGAGLLAGAALAVAVGAYHYSTGSGQASYALKVNGTTFSPGDIATRVVGNSLFATALAGNHGVTVNGDGLDEAGTVQSLVLESVEVQEAARRGLTCSSTEAANIEATQVAVGMQNSSTAEDQILASAVSFGLVPADYLRTPEAHRTPDAADAVAAYLASPQLAQAALQECKIGKLFAQVRQAARAKGEDSTGAEQDVATLRRQLLSQATVTGPALTPAPTATPTP